MNNEYPMSIRLQKIIETLFDEPVDGFIALGIGDYVPRGMKQSASDPNVNYMERINDLCVKLEEYIEIYSCELEEFDTEYDLTRIRSEARALLIVLREIANFFPEVLRKVKKQSDF